MNGSIEILCFDENRYMSRRSKRRDLRDNFFTLNIPESKHTTIKS